MISQQAVISPKAKLGANVEIGPWTMIGDDVVIGDNCKIGAHAIIQGPCIIGNNNQIFPFSSLGDAPQDKSYKGEPTQLIIGDNNVIREYCTINRGTVKGGGVTKIGNNNFFMAYAHIAHDCQLGNDIIFANYAALAGHVIVGDHVIFSAYAAVHQFCEIGAHSFVTKATYVSKDVLPFVIVAGYSPTACGLNSVGLKRRGFSSEDMDALRRAYKIIFRKNLLKQEALEELAPLAVNSRPVQDLIDAWVRSTRGIVR